MALPHNVLSVIYRHADPVTKARLRTTSKQAYRDPLMPRPLRQGYAYGTGKYQKAYNTLLKRVGIPTRKHWAYDWTLAGGETFYPTPGVSDLTDLIIFAMTAYKHAVKTGSPNISISTLAGAGERRVVRDPGPDLGFRHLRRLFPRASSYGVGAVFRHPDRERFMDTVLEFAIPELKRVETRVPRPIRNVTNAQLSEEALLHRETRKNYRHNDVFYGGAYFPPANRKAARVARRAARRLRAPQ